MKRREFITLLGGAAAWPIEARAQPARTPVVGYLYLGVPEESAPYLTAFRRGLGETGFTEGSNVAIEYRFAHNDYARLPELAGDLVRRGVAVIAVSNLSTGLAAKSATTTIPIVFHAGGDPVRNGLVTSLNRPGGNATGIHNMAGDLGAKRLELLNQLLPRASRYAVFVNSSDPSMESVVDEAHAAAASLGKDVEILRTGTNRDIDAAFSVLVEKRIDGFVMAPSPLFANRRVQIATLAARHALPAIHYAREFVEAGGLMSYGPNNIDTHRLAGIYVGRILKGEQPANLPVMRPTKFDLVINLHTARTVGIEIPPTLLALADEVLE